MEKKLFVPARTLKLPQGTAEKILKKIQQHYKQETRNASIPVLVTLFQQGATARSCDGNMSIVIFGKYFKLADIKKILLQNFCNKAERKLARTLVTENQQIALVIKIPGNLYSKI